jgi:D-amino-acid oxidase
LYQDVVRRSKKTPLLNACLFAAQHSLHSKTKLPLAALVYNSLYQYNSERKSQTKMPKVLVVGAGAIGLRTAAELLRRRVSVVLRAPRHPLDPSTCSMGAGGLWMPFHVQDPRVHRWSIETLDELLEYAKNSERNAEEQRLVEIVPSVYLQREHSGPRTEDFRQHYDAAPGGHTRVERVPEWTTDLRIHFQHLTVEMLSWQNIVHRLRIPPEHELKQAGYLHAWFFRPPIVNAPIMLEHLLDELVSNKADVDVDTGKEFDSVQDMCEHAKSLDCDAVVNCTGLGAARICDDKDMVGARGVLLHYDRSSCPRRESVRESDNSNDCVIMTEDEPWGSETMPCYLIPRGDKLVVGGSYLEGDTEETIRDDERKRLLFNAFRMGIDVEQTTVIGEWTGFRPFRTQVRCELDNSMDVPVFHSYGYGGSGWTVNVGAAKECADVLSRKLL